MSRSLRVLFASTHFARMGGLEIYNLNVAKSLQQQGAKVKAVSVFTHGRYDCEGIPTIGLQPRINLLGGLYSHLWRHILMRHLDRCQDSFDLVIAGHIYLLPAIAAFARQRGLPYWFFTFGIEIWADWSDTIQDAIAGCQKIIAISSFTAESVASRLDDGYQRIVIIHPTVDINVFTPKPRLIERHSWRILTTGRLSSTERYKGHDLVMAALPQVSATLSCPVEYWIIGDGDDRPRLELMARSLGLADQVRFFGRVSDSDLLCAYRECDIFAMPSRVQHRADGSWTGEGFGIVYIEASACELPIVAANQGGATDAVSHGVTGLLVEPTVDSVAGAISQILADGSLRERMGAAGRRFVIEHFSPALFDHRLASLLARV